MTPLVRRFYQGDDSQHVNHHTPVVKQNMQLRLPTDKTNDKINLKLRRGID